MLIRRRPAEGLCNPLQSRNGRGVSTCLVAAQNIMAAEAKRPRALGAEAAESMAAAVEAAVTPAAMVGGDITAKLF